MTTVIYSQGYDRAPRADPAPLDAADGGPELRADGRAALRLHGKGRFGLVVNRQMEEPAWTMVKTDPP